MEGGLHTYPTFWSNTTRNTATTGGRLSRLLMVNDSFERRRRTRQQREGQSAYGVLPEAQTTKRGTVLGSNTFWRKPCRRQPCDKNRCHGPADVRSVREPGTFKTSWLHGPTAASPICWTSEERPRDVCSEVPWTLSYSCAAWPRPCLPGHHRGTEGPARVRGYAAHATPVNVDASPWACSTRRMPSRFMPSDCVVQAKLQQSRNAKPPLPATVLAWKRSRCYSDV